jgi:hypothetical protein
MTIRTKLKNNVVDGGTDRQMGGGMDGWVREWVAVKPVVGLLTAIKNQFCMPYNLPINLSQVDWSLERLVGWRKSFESFWIVPVSARKRPNVGTNI